MACIALKIPVAWPAIDWTRRAAEYISISGFGHVPRGRSCMFLPAASSSCLFLELGRVGDKYVARNTPSCRYFLLRKEWRVYIMWVIWKYFARGISFLIYAFLAKELVRLIRFSEILFSYIRSTRTYLCIVTILVCKNWGVVTKLIQFTEETFEMLFRRISNH